MQETGTYPVYDELQTVMIQELRRQLAVAEKFDYLSPILSATARIKNNRYLNYDLGVECVAKTEPRPNGWHRELERADSTGIGPRRQHCSHQQNNHWKMIEPDRRRHAASAIKVASDEKSARTLPLVIFGQQGKVRADGPFVGLLPSFRAGAI